MKGFVSKVFKGLGLTLALSWAPYSRAADAIIYSVLRPIILDDSQAADALKDYYTTAGKKDGVKAGTILEVTRKTPTYNLQTERVYKDIRVPFARLKVIHVEEEASIARLEELYKPEQTPLLQPRAVIVGDLVQKISP